MTDIKKKMRILIIDDNPGFLESTHMALSKIGFDCHNSRTVEQAQELLQEEKFDLIICNYFMPECNGREALKKLGDSDPECKLILTSTYPLDVKFKKTDRFIFVDKLGLVDWLSEKYSEVLYV
ncbi:MAG: response regulator [candidate division Zixibacteria bacterium]|nr:response regulator [candidate division Zixibacteria bacterium]NIR66179.1 response regulator [candidate division Zixibacteria bacterium]NIS17259.1 response regulator [candidate division Zixibacteria bacterium]NIS47802.1 response regulator [candidate division Zixibacteria bacterium]NIT53616.1 response regulator [candidate division Zixibacteria bacterium]